MRPERNFVDLSDSKTMKLIGLAPKMYLLLESVQSWVADAFVDTYSHRSGHDTIAICGLCGQPGNEHDEDCPMPDIAKLLKELKQ